MNCVIEPKIHKSTGARYFCIYSLDKRKILLQTKSIKEVSSFIGEKYGHWGTSK